MECLKILIKNGADINQTDFTGRTAVHIASVGAKGGRLKNLIDKDADLCLKNNASHSGLHFAMKYLPQVIVKPYYLHNYFKFDVRLYFRRRVASRRRVPTPLRRS